MDDITVDRRTGLLAQAEFVNQSRNGEIDLQPFVRRCRGSPYRCDIAVPAFAGLKSHLLRRRRCRGGKGEIGSRAGVAEVPRHAVDVGEAGVVVRTVYARRQVESRAGECRFRRSGRGIENFLAPQVRIRRLAVPHAIGEQISGVARIGVAALEQHETGAVGVVKQAARESHVGVVALEVEGLAVAAAAAATHKSPFAVGEGEVFQPVHHRPGHTIEGDEIVDPPRVMGDAIGDLSADHAAQSQLPLFAFLKQTTDHVEIGEVVVVVGKIIEIVRTVGPDPGGHPTEHAVFHRDVLQRNVVGIRQESPEADAEADVLRVVVIVVGAVAQ